MESKKTLIVILNNVQQHVMALTSHLRAEYKVVYVIQCHKVDEISFT